MILLYLLLIPVIYIVIRITIYLIVYSYGKFSYDGFEAAGFAYDSEKDLFYSTKDAFQKYFGYGYIYDVGAPIFRMIIDTEPIKFYYNNKHWLITFWKGQYGITTGAEIGIYATDSQTVNKATIYRPVDNSEMLYMDFTLYKKKQKIMEVRDRHWWLAAFKLGMFSNPSELSMDIKLTFPTFDMLEAFLKSFEKVGYRKKDFTVVGNTLHFLYKKPHTRQVYTRTWLTDAYTQFKNRRNVNMYNRYLKDMIETNGIDDSLSKNKENLIMVNDLVPDAFKNKVNKTSSSIAFSVYNNTENNVEVDIFMKDDFCIIIRKRKEK